MVNKSYGFLLSEKCLHIFFGNHGKQMLEKNRRVNQVTLAIIDSRYRVKTNKTRDTGNSRLKIQSEDKQNK